MTISRSVRALLVSFALAPAAALAAPSGGTIHFQGMITEPADCRVQVAGPPQAPTALARCPAPAGLAAADHAAWQASKVSVSTRTLVLRADAQGRPLQYGQVVTLTYQ